MNENKKSLWSAVARHMMNAQYGSTPTDLVKELTEVELPKEGECAKEVKTHKDEEWIWVEGFKGMEKDMTCNEMQYEIGGRYVHEGDVKLCESGYHFCLNLKDVFGYYRLTNGRRYFRVRGLVRRNEVESYGDHVLKKFSWGGVYSSYNDKVVAKEIIIEDELTSEEIFSMVDMSDKVKGEEYFEIARRKGTDDAFTEWQCDQLTECGYSKPFVEMLRYMSTEKRNRAIAVGSEPDLSMDMKCWIIFKD